MEIYYVSCKKTTVNENSSLRRATEYRLMLVSNCTFFAFEKIKLIKNQEASRLELD